MERSPTASAPCKIFLWRRWSCLSSLYYPELSDTKVYEPYTRALLGSALHFCEVLVLKLVLFRHLIYPISDLTWHWGRFLYSQGFQYRIPETRSPKPRHIPKLETRSPKPETRNPRPGTRFPKLETPTCYALHRTVSPIFQHQRRQVLTFAAP